MRKQLLTKMLLIAASLFVGTSAWAGDKTVLKYSFDDASSPALTPGSRVSFDYTRTSVITGSKFLNAYNNTNGDPGSTTMSLGSTDLSEETWTLEFEWAACGGCNSKPDHTTLKADETSLFDISGNSNWNTTVTLSYKDGSTTLPVPGCDKGKRFTASVGDQYNTTTYWHHFVITGSTAEGVKLTVTNSSSGTKVVDGVTLSETNVSPTSIILEPCCGGAIGMDELHLYYYVAGEVVSAPEIGTPVYAAANRTVTITSGASSASNDVTTYYTIDGTDPSASNYEGSFTTVSKELTITSNCTVKAISISSTSMSSAVASRDITVGKIALAIPTISASGFTNTTGKSVNNPTFNFACDNSEIDGAPTATLYYTFTPDGGVESSETAGSSYAPTAYGTLKVIAKHDDYNSSEKTLVVSSLYTVSYTGRDYTTATTTDILSGAEDWEDEFDVDWDGWESGLKANLKKPVLSDDYHFRINNTGTCYLVNGWGWVRPDKNYGYGSRYAKEGYFVGLKVNTSKGADASALTYPTVYCASGTGVAQDVVTIDVVKANLVQQLYFYEATPTSVSSTITVAGWSTLYTPYALDFSGTGLTAYTATCDGTKVTLTPVENVPANTGVVLKGAANTYNIPVIASSSTAKGDLKGSATAAKTFDESYNYYYLAMNGANAQFKKLTSGSIAAGKAYLQLDIATSARELSVSFEEDVTAISSVELSQDKMQNEFFDLQGRRVAQPTKGLYIVNGKKIIIK